MSVIDRVFSAGPEPASGFQIVTIGVLAALIARDLFGFSRTPGGTTIRMLRCLVWLVAALAIRNPLLVHDVAVALGIGLGANLVLYFFVLAFLWVSFYLYSCYLRVQREVTSLVRHIAIQNATRGDEPPPFSRDAESSERSA